MSRFLHKILSEWLGTTLLLSIVVGSGVMAERLAQGNTAVALLGNTLATVWGCLCSLRCLARSAALISIRRCPQ